MPGPKSRWRRVLLLFGIVIVLFGLLLLCLPLWFPWLARPAAKSLGFEFGNYRPLGLTRFELTDVKGRIDNTQITAGRVEAYLPHSWLWNRWRNSGSSQGFALATDWTVRVQPRQTAPSARASLLKILDDIDKIAQLLKKWVPSADLHRGSIQLLGRTAAVPQAQWSVGLLEARLQLPPLPETIVAHLDAATAGHWRAEILGGWADLELTAELVRNENAWDMEGDLGWRSNRVDLVAQFTREGILPARLDLSATKLHLPPELHGLPHYGPLEGEFAFRWQSARFTLTAHAQADPIPVNPPAIWPPLELDLEVQGDVHEATIQALQAHAPWMNLRLLEPLTVNYSNLAASGPAAFRLEVDLAILRPDLQGQLLAQLDVRPGTDRYPTLALTLRGTQLKAGELQASDLSARASLDWPLVTLENAQAVLGSNSTAQARGVFDLQNRNVQAASIEWQGNDLHPFLPDAIGVEGCQVRVQAEGPVDRLTHHGRLEVNRLSLPQLNPLTLSLHWNGLGLQSVAGGLQAIAGNSQLLLEGELRQPDNSFTSAEARLDVLNFERDGQPIYHLTEPAHLRWQKGDSAGWIAGIDRFVWSAPDQASLTVACYMQWPEQGHLRLAAHQLALPQFRDFCSLTELPLTISLLELEADWTNSPIAWRLNSEIQLDSRDKSALQITARARGDGSGTTVETLRAEGWEAPPLVGHGRLPLSLHVAGPEFVQLLPDAPLEFSLFHEPADAVALDLDRTGTIAVAHPAINLHVTGTLDQPQGEITASFDAISLPSNRGGIPLPRLEHARLAAELRSDAILLRQFEFELEGQPVSIQGQLPLGANAWSRFLSGRGLPDLTTASGRLRIEEAELAPIAHHLPTLMTTQGKLYLDLALRPGLILEGSLSLSNAMTRPLGPLAPVREIEALIAFQGRTARLDRFTARLGGRPIHAGGHATLSENGELLYALRLVGTNAPLIRQPGLLLRANLDLALENGPGENPALTGVVELRDGLLLQDVGALLVDRLERPALRPPYFSVTNLPLANWQVNIKVSGDRFLRVRSPAFIGSVSAEGTVQGSLGRPVIQADVRIPSGRILFPFGKLVVEGAYATLSGNEPRGPLIDFTAAGQNYGYNVRLEVTGTMDSLNVLFSSTPPLSSEDILLMLTAGELPNQEISYTAEARAGRLITYLGREVATRFFGDEMGEEKLIINSGENIARSGNTTYSVEYRLTPRWSLVGEYDEFNALNAGLKWRIYSK